MSALAAVFAEARAAGRAVLIGYLPAGFPSVAEGIAAVEAMVASGVDVVEIGFPYTDPLMDGPVIQSAVETALAAGTRAADVLATIRAAADTGAPTLVMTYWNPVERFGAARFADALAAAGATGAITPDLIPEEAGPWLAAVAAAGLDPVFLVAPSSTTERLRVVGATNRGFVYAASTMGVTGARAAAPARAAELVARVRAVTDLPVGVGLGVSSGEQAALVAGYADAVIVGSALVRELLPAPLGTGRGLAGLRALSSELAAGVRSPAARPGDGLAAPVPAASPA